MFGDDEAIIDVCLFEDMPFSDEHTIINHWRAGDIMDLIVGEGLLSKEERRLSKIVSVILRRYYTMDPFSAKTKLINEYTVGVSRMTSNLMAGSNFEIEDMDRKIREIKLKRILD